MQKYNRVDAVGYSNTFEVIFSTAETNSVREKQTKKRHPHTSAQVAARE
jgi:hypothetical protein